MEARYRADVDARRLPGDNAPLLLDKRMVDGRVKRQCWLSHAEAERRLQREFAALMETAPRAYQDRGASASGPTIGVATFGSGSWHLVLEVLLMKMMPTVNIMITREWVLRAALFALASGVIGSLYPAYKAASQDPIEALAYE